MNGPGAAEATAALIKLVETCRDGELDFQAAAAAIEDPTLRQLCVSYADQRAAFRHELLEELADLEGGAPEGAADDGRLPAAEGGSVTLAELARRDAAAESAYRDVLDRGLPGQAINTVERQHQQMVDALKHLNLLERALPAVA
ncbi:MAG: DUF2383 domain-containing protein [Gemmatimonadales bacterium]